jgi:hypothetical protein
VATADESQELIYGPSLIMQRAHSSAWIEWLPAKQLVEGSSPSGPVTISVLFSGFQQNKGEKKEWNYNQNWTLGR